MTASEGERVRAVVAAGGIALSGVLSLQCGGTFCDAYPEACGSAGGDSPGGSGGGPAAGAGTPGGGSVGGEGGAGGAQRELLDVEVTVVDDEGDALPNAPLLVSDADGALLSQTSTGVDGAVMISAPEHAYVWAFVEVGALRHVFAAEVVAGISTLRFLGAADEPVANTPKDRQFDFYCLSECGVAQEGSLSCRKPVPFTDAGPYFVQPVSQYVGCAGKSQFDATVVGYDAAGKAVGVGVVESIAVSSNGLIGPKVTAVSASQRFDLQMTVTGSFNFDIERWVRVPNADGRGYGFSRYTDATTASVELSLVKSVVPTFVAGTTIKFSPTQFLLHQETLTGVTSDTEVTTDVEQLALPGAGSSVDVSRPNQPVVPFSLGEGPLGDALVLVVNVDENVRWTIAQPPTTNGSVRLPELPAALSAYALTGGSVSATHIDLDQVDGYASWALTEIVDPLRTETWDDLTVTAAL